MIRVKISIHHHRRIWPLLLAPLLILLLSASIGPEPAASMPAAFIPAENVPADVTLPATKPGYFYLTSKSYYPSQALYACAYGYHMASFWEIYDVSNLTYDHTRADAVKKADSGIGPPSFWHGWVRTGDSSSGSATTGTGNCSNWTTNSSSAYGVSVRLSNRWETAPGDIGPWDANSFSCNTIGPVWCVSSASPSITLTEEMYLPNVTR